MEEIITEETDHVRWCGNEVDVVQIEDQYVEAVKTPKVEKDNHVSR